MELVYGEPKVVGCDRLLVGLRAGHMRDDISVAVPELDGLEDRLKHTGFAARAGEMLVLQPLGLLPECQEVVIVGLGDVAAGEEWFVPRGSILQLSPVAVTGLLLPAPDFDWKSVVRLVDWIADGYYRYDPVVHDRAGARPVDLTFVVGGANLVVQEDMSREFASIENLVSSIWWVRDLVNMPANIANIERLMSEAMALGTIEGIVCDVSDDESLAEKGFGGIRAVGAGGSMPPALVVLEYQPPVTPLTWIGLVGKGVIFDSGGYHLKELDEMLLMKADMVGAASVLGILRYVALERLPIRLSVAVPFVENLLDSHSYKPGNVVKHWNGTTAEIVDPDNEGRLIVADALAYLAARDLDVLVDVAGLTDAGGLGPDIWGLFANDDRLAQEILASGLAVQEPGWRLPLWEPYMQRLKSLVADIRNADPETDSAVLAALYLWNFVGGRRWAHIDAGPGHSAFHRINGFDQATGVPVRTLVHWLRNRASAYVEL